MTPVDVDDLCGECASNPCVCGFEDEEDEFDAADCSNCGEATHLEYLRFVSERDGRYCEICIEDLHLTPNEPPDGEHDDE